METRKSSRNKQKKLNFEKRDYELVKIKTIKKKITINQKILLWNFKQFSTIKKEYEEDSSEEMSDGKNLFIFQIFWKKKCS